MSTSKAKLSAIVRNDGREVSLVLYKFDGCPYCQRVLTQASSLGLTLETRDTRQDPSALETLLRVGKRKTVPCLFVDGIALYESNDIIQFLQNEVRASGPVRS